MLTGAVFLTAPKYNQPNRPSSEMETQNAEYTYVGILFGHKKE